MLAQGICPFRTSSPCARPAKQVSCADHADKKRLQFREKLANPVDDLSMSAFMLHVSFHSGLVDCSMVLVIKRSLPSSISTYGSLTPGQAQNKGNKRELSLAHDIPVLPFTLRSLARMTATGREGRDIPNWLDSHL